jgi:mRNA-degrading endonuclease RelE of RelBE toxin-antitoxin system
MDFDTIRFIEEAYEDLEKLDRSVQIFAIKKLKQPDKNHLLGKPPGNVSNRDLSGFYKLYFNDNKYRIVYRLEKGKVHIEGIQEANIEVGIAEAETAIVFGIGKRDKFEVYEDVFKRIN